MTPVLSNLERSFPHKYLAWFFPVTISGVPRTKKGRLLAPPVLFLTWYIRVLPKLFPKKKKKKHYLLPGGWRFIIAMIQQPTYEKPATQVQKLHMYIPLVRSVLSVLCSYHYIS